MRTSLLHSVRLFAAVMTLASCGWLAPLHAQTAGADHARFVALPDDFPDVGAKLLLIREPGRDVVVLNPADPSVDALATGVMLIGRLGQRPLDPGVGQMVPVTGYVPVRPMTDEWRRSLEAALAELRRRPPVPLGDLGRGRWMRLRGR